MSTVQEIEAAIRLLSPDEREQLARVLPALLPEVDGDAQWERIIRDSGPRPGLTAALNETEIEYRRDPGTFREIKEIDFDRPL